MYENIEELYCKHQSTQKVASIIGCDKSTVGRALKRKGVKLRPPGSHGRKYKLDEAYFDLIDSEEKAYYLGLMYADGANSTTNYQVAIGLQEKDRPTLERMRIALNYEADLEFKKGEQRADSYRLYIYSKYMSRSLAKLGCLSPKSLTLVFPTFLLPGLIRHFIRGYVDGDGSVTVTPPKSYRLEIAGTQPFCEEVSHIFKDTLSVSGKVRKHGSVYTWYKNGQEAIKVMSWLYDDSKVRMERKFDKYLEAKEGSWAMFRSLDTIKAELLIKLYSKLGSWSAVAIHLNTSDKVIRRLRRINYV
jgi:hypothetical protein